MEFGEVMQKTIEFKGKVYEMVLQNDSCTCCAFKDIFCGIPNDAAEEKYGHRCESNYIYVEQVIQKQEGEKKMKIEMPKVVQESPAKVLEKMVPTLIKFEGEVQTAVLVCNEVLIITTEGMMWEPYKDFLRVDGYEVVRPYTPGEKLVIEA